MESKLTNKQSWKLNFFIVFLVYCIAHVLMLISNGVWWDDFTVWNVTSESLYTYLGPANANEVAQYTYIRLVTDLFTLNQQVYVFHFMSFLFQGVSLLCCWLLLKKITADKTFTTMCCLLMAVFGFDTTSMLIICTHYTVATCFFLLGLLACVYELYNSKKYLLVLAGVAWLVSVLVWRSAALLMPFCIMVLSFVATKSSWRTFDGWKEALKYVFVHYWPTILILSVFFPIYILFLRPSGFYAAYYSPQLKCILSSPLTACVSAGQAVVLTIGESLKALCDNASIIAISIFVLLIYVTYKCLSYILDEPNNESKYGTLSILAFIYLLVSMMLPLWAYNFLLVLDISQYGSRLLSLGALPLSIITVYLLNNVSKKYRYLVFAILFVGSASYTTYSYISYAYAWNKTEIMVEYFKQNPELESKNILVLDHAYEANENESFLRYYAYEGMARMAYGTNTQTKAETIYDEYYGASFKPDYRLRCYVNHLPITKKNKCELVFSKWLFKRKYQRLKGDMLHIEHEKIEK